MAPFVKHIFDFNYSKKNNVQHRLKIQSFGDNIPSNLLWLCVLPFVAGAGFPSGPSRCRRTCSGGPSRLQRPQGGSGCGSKTGSLWPRGRESFLFDASALWPRWPRGRGVVWCHRGPASARCGRGSRSTWWPSAPTEACTKLGAPIPIEEKNKKNN